MVSLKTEKVKALVIGEMKMLMAWVTLMHMAVLRNLEERALHLGQQFHLLFGLAWIPTAILV